MVHSTYEHSSKSHLLVFIKGWVHVKKDEVLIRNTTNLEQLEHKP